MKNIVFQALADAACSDEPVALGIITGVKGSSPQKVGAKALFYRDGRIREYRDAAHCAGSIVLSMAKNRPTGAPKN